MNRGILFFIVFAACMLALCVGLYFAFPPSYSSDVVTFDTAALSIEKAGGRRVHFDVEVAKNRDQLAQGLMYRKEMADDAGMLFLYPVQSRVAFWMKNTLIPLDMIFAGRDGVIRSVHRNAKPLDESHIAPPHLVFMVLEVNAGIVDAHGIQAGDKIIYDLGD